MTKRTVNNNKTSISKLPNDKPVVYKIKTDSGIVNYVGVAKRGRVQECLAEHLPGGKDYVPGAKVQIEQVCSIADARKKERTVIAKALTQKVIRVKSPVRTGRITREVARSVVKGVIDIRKTGGGQSAAAMALASVALRAPSPRAG
ncbi:MAG: hypothetical protein OEV87_12520 [Phycisphaerae bacterium]|nr:hypothetical protein [Phycisphaerae bacterium]